MTPATSAWRPPSTRIVSPVMKSLSTSASTAFAISISPPQRPSGVACSTAADRLRRCPAARRWARRNGVDENLIARQFERQRLRQRDHAGFRHVVRQVSSIARPAAPRHPVGEVDNASALARRICGIAACEQSQAARDRSTVAYPSPRASDRRSAFRDTPTPCSQDVEPSELRYGLFDHAAARIRLLQIA